MIEIIRKSIRLVFDVIAWMGCGVLVFIGGWGAILFAALLMWVYPEANEDTTIPVGLIIGSMIGGLIFALVILPWIKGILA